MNAQINIIAIMEQFEAQAINTAKILGAYYEELVKNGVPRDLAAHMTSDFNSIIWGSALSNKQNKEGKE